MTREEERMDQAAEEAKYATVEEIEDRAIDEHAAQAFGPVPLQDVCWYCDGAGHIENGTCPKCNGVGVGGLSARALAYLSMPEFRNRSDGFMVRALRRKFGWGQKWAEGIVWKYRRQEMLGK